MSVAYALALVVAIGWLALIVGFVLGCEWRDAHGPEPAEVRTVDRLQVLVLPVIPGSVTDASDPLTTVVNMPKQARH